LHPFLHTSIPNSSSILHPVFYNLATFVVLFHHRLNMELDLQSLFGLHVNSCTHWLRPRNSPSPRIWAHLRGSYWSAKIDDISL
jgi:hypothetical protein